MQVNMTLSTENCENISAEGATVANVGADKQISYTVLPGKGLDAEVTAEVRDFEMDAIAINGIKLDLDIEVDDKELMEKVTEIMNAARDLDDGAASLQASLSYEKYMASLKEAGLDLTQLQTGNTAAIQTLTAQINELSAAMEQIKSIPGYESDETCMGQLAQLDGSYEQFDAAIANLVNSVSGIADKVGALKSGVDQLAESYGSLNGGINSYTGGVGSIVSAYSQIVTATEALVEGSGKLTEGSASLRQGTAELYDGIVSLDDGAKELNDGTKEFYEKTDGMDSEIEDKIDDMLNSISRSDAVIRSFVSEKNTNVESVQFVIKTGAIEKPEVVQTVEDETQQLNLWEKFLRLFGR